MIFNSGRAAACAARARGAGRRAGAVCFLLLLCAASASAYTLVMRGGRRVEIPDSFRLAAGQLTYEAAPGLSVTVLLDLVDVAATERANGEPAGSFHRRATAAPRDESAAAPRAATRVTTAAPSQPTAARTLTNRELEAVRRGRVESERAYERRRAELGLPSAEETRRREREEEESMRERALRKWEDDEDAEGYWRERAAGLRSETGALDAEINYLRQLLAEMSGTSSVGFSSFGGLSAGALTITLGARPFLRGGFPRASHFGAFQTFGGRRGGTRVGAGVAIGGGGTRARFGLVKGGQRRSPFARNFPQRHFLRQRSPFFAPGLVGLTAPFDYRSADAAALLTRLHLLEAERAGLAERWWQLQEEARRAGASPGWLRP